jgi:hypothetical protein
MSPPNRLDRDSEVAALVAEIHTRKRQIVRLRQELNRLEQELVLAELRAPVALPPLPPLPATPGPAMILPPLAVPTRQLADAGQGVR